LTRLGRLAHPELVAFCLAAAENDQHSRSIVDLVWFRGWFHVLSLRRGYMIILQSQVLSGKNVTPDAGRIAGRRTSNVGVIFRS
jgi:hypothetical protein